MAGRSVRTLGKWRERAICLNRGVSFFPERNLSLAAKAKAVCAMCPVRAECLDEAIANKERFGIWGGMDQEERRKEARRRRQEAAKAKETSA